ncbi:MAG: hypothetical protein V4671_13525 [Armatimonadota bacterium]
MIAPCPVCVHRPRARRTAVMLIVTLVVLLWTIAAAKAAQAADKLLFCNQPERMMAGGAHADTLLSAGETYRIFFHFRNGTRSTAPFVVAFQGQKKSLSLTVQKGIADPRSDPSEAGKQATARFMASPAKRYVGKSGAVRFPLRLKQHEVASGVLTVRADQNVRMRLYFRHNNSTVPGARVVTVDAPRRDYTVSFTPGAGKRQYFRIGVPEPGMSRHLDGTYGLVYSFRVNAPAGSKVRVAFSPRGGKSGLVGTVDGAMHQSRIVGTAVWSAFAEAVVGKNGMVVTTLPFGGVFYPVELVFQLL